MKIKNINKIKYNNKIDVYDVINVPDTNNFLISTNSGYIVSHNCGIMDEMNFAKGANASIEKSKIIKSYSSVLERINSRFIVDGKTQGKLFLVSSKKSENDFIESYIKKQRGKPGVYVIDAILWNVKPSGTYSGRTFPVAVGGSNLPSRILNDDEDIESVRRQGYEIIYPPVEFRSRFELDLPVALMNIAGISISNVTKFISYINLFKCYNNSKNPFTNTILTIGMNDTLKIQDFFIPQLVPYEIYSMPLFIHLDMSITGDITGIGCVAAMGYKYFNEYSLDEGDVVPTKKLVYRHVFTVGIQCPQGTEISLQKNRDFIYYLKYTLGWNIRGISTDGFQSYDTRQQLTTMGFDDVSLLSLDKTPNGYLTGKAAINEQRISMLCIPELEKELINLERDNVTGKIDHNSDNTKDLSDGIIGALYNASLHEQEFTFSFIEDTDTILDANVQDNDRDDRQSILDNLVSTKQYYNDNESIIDSSLYDNSMDNSLNNEKDIINSIENISNKAPEIKLSDAMKEYLDELKNNESELEITNNLMNNIPDPVEEARKKFMEAKARQHNTSINKSDEYNNLEDYMNNKDGILMF